MNVILIILAILILIITANLLITVNLKYNIFENAGNIKLKLFGVIVFNSKITISGDYLNLSKKKDKVIKIKIDINDQQIQFFKDIQTYMAKKIYPLKIKANLDLCAASPFLISILSSVLNIFILIFYTKFKTYHKDVTLLKNINTGFRHDLLNLDFTFSFSVSIYDYFWAYYKALRAERRRLREKKKNIAK